jgi:tRNA (guanine26-N2/guanine27-N2)-dimethyltransferase
MSQYEADFPTEEIVEGEARVLVPKLKAFVKQPSEYAPSRAPVFYNPVMELNRDLSVIAVQAYQEKMKRDISVCEPLAGSGIRGIRYAKEIRGVRKVIIGDLTERSTNLESHNVELNRLQALIEVQNREANLLLSNYTAPHRRFDVVDIDPFGSPIPYVDSALRALRNKGLLAVTATDLAPLCGVHSKACVRRYGGKPLRTEYCHELAVRLLVGCIAALAAKRDISIEVMFSHSTDHYIRTYTVISFGAKKADDTLRSIGYVGHCFRCLHREAIQDSSLYGRSDRCVECGAKLSIAGPLWIGGICEQNFCRLMKETAFRRRFTNQRRIDRLLSLAYEESTSPVGYYVVDELCDFYGFPVPPLNDTFEAVRSKDPEASLTHFHSRGIKTVLSADEMRMIITQLVSSRSSSDKS